MIDLRFGDALELMKQIPDNSIDCVVTDCPYRIVAGGVSLKREDSPSGCLNRKYVSDGTRCSNKWIKKDINDVPSACRQGKMFLHNDMEFEDWLPDLFRVLKNGTHCYIMINDRNLKELQQKAEDVGFKFVNLLVWKKNNATPNKFYMKSMEFILMLRKGGERYINNMGTSNFLNIPNIIGGKLHPTEKPVELMQILIENSTNVGETVLDPFAGSGSTGVACKLLNRDFIGMEIDEKYYNIAKDRLNGVYQKEVNLDGSPLFN